MKIEFLGQACFVLTTEDGTRIVTDPYAVGGGIRYAEVGVSADGVTVSHGHSDHANVDGVGGGPTVINTAAGGSVGSVKIRPRTTPQAAHSAARTSSSSLRQTASASRTWATWATP